MRFPGVYANHEGTGDIDIFAPYTIVAPSRRMALSPTGSMASTRTRPGATATSASMPTTSASRPRARNSTMARLPSPKASTVGIGVPATLTLPPAAASSRPRAALPTACGAITVTASPPRAPTPTASWPITTSVPRTTGASTSRSGAASIPAGRRAYLTSSKRGRLKTGVATRGYSLHAELGYGFDLGDHVVLVPRVRLRGPNISVDKFTDAVNARVSFEDIGRLIGGFGLTVHSTLPVDGGEIWLRGALDLWMAAIAGTASRSASV